MSPTGNPKVPSIKPTVDAYRRAFLACRDGMSDLDLAMLEAHHRAPNHTVTAGELAQAVGLPSHSAANLRYGLFAGKLCNVLGLRPEFNIEALVSFSGGDDPGEEFIQWTMLPGVVAALESMRWVRPA